jgi:ElaB/YqjD/DUF883 family membrane-anchored ribosome-binding protein
MEQQQPESSAGEMMVFGLIEQADRMGKSAQGTQRALTEQIGELAQLQEWAVNAAMELQKRADATIQKLEAERAQLQSAGVNLERQAVQAIQGAVRQQSSEIERQTVQAFAAPLRDIQQAAGYVRQNMKEVSWLMIGLMFSAGLVIGLLLGYWPLRSGQNSMQEQVNRIEQYLAAQQQPVPTAAVPDPHAPAHKGKAK